jgi:hypothetical protein
MSRAGEEGARAALEVLQPPSSPSTQQRTAQDKGEAWRALAETITAGSGSEAAEVGELVAAFTAASRVLGEVVEDGDDDETGKKEEDDGGVTVEKLSLEPQQVGGLAVPVAKMDRENGMVLVAELLRHFPEELSTLRRPLEAVLNKGAELVAQDRGHN